MQSSLRHASTRRHRFRRGVCALLLTTFMLTAAGVPLPGGTQMPAGDGEAFMCATSGCGCRTAEQCWRSCCCHSFAEHMAWAQKNGVRPPDFAIAQARAAGYDLSWLDARKKQQVAQASGRLKCSKPAVDCCQSSKPVVASSCCDKQKSHAAVAGTTRSCCESNNTTPRQEPNESRSNTVIAWKALKCGGHAMNWLAAAPILVGSRVEFEFQLQLAAWLPAIGQDRPFGIIALPMVPPPERA